MGPKTILLVDDEESDRVVIRRILEAKGYRILEADTYQRALAVFSEHRDEIALVITDISLPGGNGCDLWVSMRKSKDRLQVLFVSGHVGAEVCRFYGLEPSALHFFGKPFKPADLVARVTEVLDSDELPKLRGVYRNDNEHPNGAKEGNGSPGP